MSNKITSLTKAGIRNLLEMEKPSDNDEKIYLQVTQVKLFEEKKKKNSIKQRLILSDGVSSSIVMVDNKRYDKMQSTGNNVKLNDIVAITKCNKNEVSGRKLLVLTDIWEVIYTGLKDKIGDPKDYIANVKKDRFPYDETDISIPDEAVEKDNFDEAQTGADLESPKKFKSASINESQEFTPIKALNSYVPDWKIKAKVVRKGEVKRWSNSRGEGYLMNIDLIDLQGNMIQGTFFKEAVDKFDPILDQGGIYTFSNGAIKQANKKFSSINNDFCIHFGNDAEIDCIGEDESIAGPSLEFTKINDVVSMENGRWVNIVGVVIDISDIETIRLRAGGEKNKRMITVADNSEEPVGCCIKIWFWGVQAQEVGFNIGDIVSFTSLRISDFNGRSLNTSSDTSSMLNPSCPEAKKLARWFKDSSISAEFKSLTQQRSDGEKRSNEKVRMISEVNKELSSNPNGWNDFFVLNGYVSFIKADEKATYLGCPDCHRKVFQDYEGNCRCENWNKNLEEGGEHIYMLSAKICDGSDSIFVNFYRQNAEPIMGGMTADTFHQFREQNLQANPNQKKDSFKFDLFKERISTNFYRHHSILLKVRPEQHNDEIRFKYVGTKVLDYSFKKDNWNLLDRLELFESKQEMTPEEYFAN